MSRSPGQERARNVSAATRNGVAAGGRLGHDRVVELEWGYFRQLYEGLLDHDDRRACLSRHQLTAADHLAELEPLRKREPIPARGDNEQSWRIMKLYGLSRVGDYLIERF